MKILTNFDLPCNLELGSGNNPQPGFIHLDIAEHFPQVDIVCDLSREGIPLPDNSVRRLIHNHLIEHIPWRQAPSLVREMSRVMVPGGEMIFRTPDLRFICESYLNNRITPEWPGDENAMVKIYGEMNPSNWAIIKLFSGQDYPSNFHFCCYDFETVELLLTRNGFRTVKRTSLTTEFSPGELQIIAYK